ncbi:MAG TPA: hypothetical protein VG457_02310, partial [Planctomycetota bacterium]|nr:hypothetical protein [Planctomycetota bacterium]
MLASLVAAVLVLAQDPAPKGAPETVDRIFMQDRSELRGEILGCTTSGRLKVRLAGIERPLDLGLEEIARLRFTTDEARPAVPVGEQFRLAGGGAISGKLQSFDGEIAVVESAA